VKDNTVNIITQSGVCCGCGTCQPVCPVNCITMQIDKDGQYQPVIDMNVCTNCGLCFKVCPNSEFNYKNEIAVPEEVYSGYSLNEELRYNSASGGLVTQLLADGLRQNEFDAVVVVTGDKPSDYKASIVTNEKELFEAKASKYSQVDVNIILDKLNDSNYKKICYVGLPCHIRGVEKYLGVKKRLSEKIVLKFSLVCGQSLKHTAIDRQLNILKIEKKLLEKYSFRGDGWPGNQKITGNNRNIKVAYTDKKAMGGLFASPLSGVDACLYCEDHFGCKADISFCDAWHLKGKEDGDGITSALCYSNNGKSFIKRVHKQSDTFFIKTDNFDNIISVQGHMRPTPVINFLLKKRIKDSRIKLASELNVSGAATIAAIFYSFSVKILKIIGIKRLPLSVLSLSRGLKKILQIK